MRQAFFALGRGDCQARLRNADFCHVSNENGETLLLQAALPGTRIALQNVVVDAFLVCAFQVVDEHLRIILPNNHNRTKRVAFHLPQHINHDLQVVARRAERHYTPCVVRDAERLVARASHDLRQRQRPLREPERVADEVHVLRVELGRVIRDHVEQVRVVVPLLEFGHLMFILKLELGGVLQLLVAFQALVYKLCARLEPGRRDFLSSGPRRLDQHTGAL
ncbi:AraC family transcriptional regulator [Babesia caballi]|uniref:AraC family transcriptional regulator n=1 Tax=Babesia caballi TaxID=5871 RepID=A0AAV4LSH9_BABCB|nr:AraC family transcriptional regulator [Babesia caballi]